MYQYIYIYPKFKFTLKMKNIFPNIGNYYCIKKIKKLQFHVLCKNIQNYAYKTYLKSKA